MNTKLVREIADRAYALDAERMEQVLQEHGLPRWTEVEPLLEYRSWDTGGGCMMMVADLPGSDGYRVGVTGDDAELPTRLEDGWFGILDPSGEELYAVFLKDPTELPTGRSGV